MGQEEFTEEDLFGDDVVAGNDESLPGNDDSDDSFTDVDSTDESNYSEEDTNENELDEGELTGVERFLTSYGIVGGVIKYEDGEDALFSELSPIEQEEILGSLTTSATPTAEEKYDLDSEEINLLNTLRESEQTAEEFINNIVDYRLNSVLNQRDSIDEDFINMPDEALFVRHLSDTIEGITEDEIARELEKASELDSFGSTVNTIRDSYTARQSIMAQNSKAEEEGVFSENLEEQRREVVNTVEGLNDVAGVPITNDMKEYLLHDIMELNSSRDPILMERIFSDPETMFKVNWFLNYGESHINGLNDYWKKEVSKASKTGYSRAVRGMPGEPVQRGGNMLQGGQAPQQKGNGGYGDILSEEDLFE